MSNTITLHLPQTLIVAMRNDYAASVDQITRIETICRQSLNEIDFTTLSQLLNGLRTNLQQLEVATKNAQETGKKKKEELNTELGMIAASKATLSQEYANKESECTQLMSSITDLTSKCSSLVTDRSTSQTKLKELHKTETAIKNKRWNILRDILPGHGLMSGILIDKSVKSGLLRSIPGYSQTVGIKSLVQKEYAAIYAAIKKNENALAETTKDLESKQKTLTENETKLPPIKALLDEKKAIIESKSRDIHELGIKIDNLNNVYVALGRLVNRCEQLDAGVRLIARKCDRQRISLDEFRNLIDTFSTFKGDFNKIGYI